ncbi:polyubiquitin-like [Amblyraja radiata]|uniref:polyubiquitin-like n=1 Tax=Amblyraja radiata TaxID=386614 RepID=UPI0014020551|nr:polyubiquitin-like [Amblyraja radiata]
MRLQLKYLTGESFQLDVDPNIQVSALKEKIYQATQVPGFQQRLMVQNGQQVELRDNSRLRDYNLPPDSTVMLLIRKEERIQIILRNVKGKMTTYDVLPSESVQEFKQKVHRQEGVTPDQQHLTFESNQLEDGRLLSDYNIRSQSIIQLVLRLRGGLFALD